MTQAFCGVWPTKLGAHKHIKKSHTLIVIDEKAVISGVELVGKEMPVGRSVFVFLFGRFSGVVKALCIRSGPICRKKPRTEDGWDLFYFITLKYNFFFKYFKVLIYIRHNYLYLKVHTKIWGIIWEIHWKSYPSKIWNGEGTFNTNNSTAIINSV